MGKCPKLPSSAIDWMHPHFFIFPPPPSAPLQPQQHCPIENYRRHIGALIGENWPPYKRITREMSPFAAMMHPWFAGGYRRFFAAAAIIAYAATIIAWEYGGGMIAYDRGGRSSRNTTAATDERSPLPQPLLLLSAVWLRYGKSGQMTYTALILYHCGNNCRYRIDNTP